MSFELKPGMPVIYGTHGLGYIGTPPAGMAPQPSPDHVWVTYDVPNRGVHRDVLLGYDGEDRIVERPYIHYGGWFKKSDISPRKPTNESKEND